MCLALKILVLLWLINMAPPLLALLLEERGRTPVDLGRRLKDGQPLLGPHKTIRGVLAGVATGGLIGWLMGFPAGIGLSCGALSMIGDSLTSFIKRRLGKPGGAVMAGLDQLLEGALPFLVLTPYARLGALPSTGLILLFCAGAYAGSFFFASIFLKRRTQHYPRKLRPRQRFREWRACDMAYHPLHPFFNFERAIYYHLLMKTAFRLMGLYARGKQNALAIRLNPVTLRFEDLPAAFDDYTILLLSDLHLDGLEGLTEQIKALVAPLTVDLCLFGGDYRTEWSGPYSKVLIRMRRLLHAINARDGRYAVLGNHDCTEMVRPLENKGLSFLLNEAVALKRGEDRIWLVGIDDPHYYRAHDLPQAFAEVPSRAFSILLAHSPEAYVQAASYGVNLYLCGHTHAGQVQVPAIGPVFTHSRAPRKYSQGHWQFGRMQGYTSAGVGVSGIPVRFGTLGEVVLIRLKRKAPPAPAIPTLPAR
jgi:predicted MPP superfamily phosphohydrolase